MRTTATARRLSVVLPLAGVLTLTVHLVGSLAAVAGPLVFARPGAGGVSELWTANANGGGVERLNVDLPQPDRPVWSKDGLSLLVTSNDPGSSQLSLNVYGVDPGTGQATKLTNYQDGNEFNPNTQQFESFYSLPLFKSAAPNNTSFAVSRLFRRGVASNFSTTPILEKKADASSPPEPLNFGALLDGFHTAGAGVDWSPGGGTIVTPLAFTQGNGQTVTPLGVFSPTGSLLGALTSPQASVLSTGQTWQNDYQPAFSPDGSRVAYFRSTEFVSATTIPPQRAASDVELRIINSDGSGDRAIVDFTPGTWPNQMSWSPDGTQLVFDFGPQLLQGGQPLFSSDLSQTEVWRVNLDGSGLGRLLAAPASFITWRPAVAPGDFNSDGSINQADYDLWASGYGATVAPGEGPDANRDGSIDAADYTIWRDALAADAASVSAPEPSGSAGLVLAASLAACRAARRRATGTTPGSRERNPRR
ncbi:hypothetical protein [Botrimarina sp.]|uniref:hypothetical protein n=1 Tax=Botrimarina sp. TaxID=2795802 RepID=UPI0032EBCBF4